MKTLILLLLISSVANAKDTDLLYVANFHYNNDVSYVSDMKQWKKQDYWMSPKELSKRKIGDCEDFAIAKYFLLKKLGIDENLMRISHVSMNGQPHAVLIYYSKTNSPVVLDNTTDKIIYLKDRADLKKVYSFNEHHLWVNDNYVGSADRISIWKDLKQKIGSDNVH